MNKINKLFQIQDNSEKIRDRIAAILKLELQNQKLLADKIEIENKKDFDINVFLENSRPWQLTGDNKEDSPFPLVNIVLQEINKDMGSRSNQNLVKYTGLYFIDCYGCGNIEQENADEAEEYSRDDSLSTIRAWKTARIIRNIIMSTFYTYLGMQNIVRSRLISKIETGKPPNYDGAVAVTVCRIHLQVDFEEDSIEGEYANLEGINFVSDNTGKINLINISHNINKED